MNFHSACFIVHAKLENGRLESTVFEGQFFASESFIRGTGIRANALFLYALRTYERGMIAPKGYQLQFEKDTARFQWQITSENLNARSKVLLINARYHLSNMVNYLQIPQFNLPILQNYQVFESSPEFFSQYTKVIQIGEQSRAAYHHFLKGVYNNPNPRNLELFIKHIPNINREEGSVLSNEERGMIDVLLVKVTQSSYLWSQTEYDNARHLSEFLSFLVKENIAISDLFLEVVISFLSLHILENPFLGGF